jgi:2-polyprenyl-6-methoxyphenol hydroxylase-like FAD-dependent oxidoreductase
MLFEPRTECEHLNQLQHPGSVGGVGGERRIVVLGGGAGGLLTALVLGNVEHEVVVLERDPAQPPDSDDEAWDEWDRRGVPQMRQPHALMGRGCEVLAAEAPDAFDAIVAVAPAMPLRAPDPQAITAADRQFAARVIRRVTLERLLAVEADRHPNVTVRRGVVVEGFITGSDVVTGRPHVQGVTTAAHGEFGADLVVDSLGRRSPVGEWVETLGTPVERSSEPDGFTYFSRWFRSIEPPTAPPSPGQAPDVFVGLVPGLAALQFAGDGQTCGVALVGSISDRRLLRLRDPACFMRVARSFPALDRWTDPTAAEPITDVVPMGSIQNRHLRLRTHDRPGPTGIVTTGDSGVSTNPSLGRGVAIAADLAVALRDVLDETDGAADVADRWDDVHLKRHRPWLDDAVASDLAMRRGFAAAVDPGNPDPPADTPRSLLQRAAMVDLRCWRAWGSIADVFQTPSDVLDDDGLVAHAREVVGDMPAAPPPFDMTRAEFEAVLG